MKDKLEQYLDLYLQPIKHKSFFQAANAMMGSKEKCAAAPIREENFECLEESSINEFIENNKEEKTFQTELFKYIDEKGLKDSDVYNKVNIDRRLFSKIRSNKDYHPSKETIILLGIALELSEEEIEDLLGKASYSLPMNTTYDLIIRFCFKEHIYDLFQINEFLEDHHCKTLVE